MYISSIGINHLWNHLLLDCALSARFSYVESAFGVRTITNLSVAHPRAKNVYAEVPRPHRPFFPSAPRLHASLHSFLQTRWTGSPDSLL